MIYFGKREGTETLSTKDRDNLIRQCLTWNRDVYDDFFNEQIIKGQVGEAFSITLKGKNNLYPKLALQNGESYIVKL